MHVAGTRWANVQVGLAAAEAKSMNALGRSFGLCIVPASVVMLQRTNLLVGVVVPYLELFFEFNWLRVKFVLLQNLRQFFQFQVDVPINQFGYPRSIMCFIRISSATQEVMPVLEKFPDLEKGQSSRLRRVPMWLEWKWVSNAQSRHSFQMSLGEKCSREKGEDQLWSTFARIWIEGPGLDLGWLFLVDAFKILVVVHISSVD